MSEHLHRYFLLLIYMYIVTYLSSEPDSCFPQGLTLGLVDCRRKCSPHRKLAAMPFEGILSHCWNECDSWEQNSSEVPDNLAFQELVVNASLVDQLGPIA